MQMPNNMAGVATGLQWLQVIARQPLHLVPYRLWMSGDSLCWWMHQVGLAGSVLDRAALYRTVPHRFCTAVPGSAGVADACYH